MISPEPTAAAPKPPARRWSKWIFIATVLVVALVSAGVAGLLVNIFNHKQEEKNIYLRLVNVTADTTDPAPWGINWPHEYDSYKMTSTPTKTQFGGGDTLPPEKAESFPWLTRMFAGYAFSLDYRDRHGHAFMLLDQENTRRVTEKQQPGACLHCHASIIPTYRRIGEGDVMKGFEAVCAMKYQDAHAEIVKTGSSNPNDSNGQQPGTHIAGAHPVSCVDCHDPKSMELRVTRPGFIRGIAALKKHQGIEQYDVNRDATRQEMRSFVCGQCHVEYYFRGDQKTLTYPWANGTKVEEIEAYYDNHSNFADSKPFTDWLHKETGAKTLKAQHPEFETWSQGIHARSGVSCADCHMPYKREGATKVSDHWVRSPLLNINRACQVCHHYDETEIRSRVETIQTRHVALLQRAGQSLVGMLDAVKVAKANGATDAQLQSALALHRKAQWRLDFVAAENSMGFHAPQESARVLAESIDYSNQARIAALSIFLPENIRNPNTPPATQPTAPTRSAGPS